MKLFYVIVLLATFLGKEVVLDALVSEKQVGTIIAGEAEDTSENECSTGYEDEISLEPQSEKWSLNHLVQIQSEYSNQIFQAGLFNPYIEIHCPPPEILS